MPQPKESAYDRAMRWSQDVPGEPIPISLEDAWEIAEHFSAMELHVKRSVSEIQTMIVQGWAAIGTSKLVII